MYKPGCLFKLLFGSLVGLSIVFGLLPDDQRTGLMNWLVPLLAAGLAIFLSMVYRQRLGTWLGWLSVTAALMLALIWLRFQWTASNAMVQHVNISVAVLAWALLIAMFFSSALMLKRGEASIIFAGLAYLIVPVVFIAIGAQYHTQLQMTNATLGEQIVWGVPMMWAICIGCISLPAFLLHSLIVLFKEVKER